MIGAVVVGGLLAGFVPVAALWSWAGATGAGHAPDRSSTVPARRSGPVDQRAVALLLVLVVAVPFVIAAVAGLSIIVLVVGSAAALWVRSRTLAGRARRARRSVDRAVPDAIDLLLLAAVCGHPPHRCVRLVADRVPVEVRTAFGATCRALDRGVSLVDAVDHLRTGLGTLGDPVADALVDAFRTGTPLGPALDRVAATARDGRRRSAESEARRLPVLLLFPLVCCVLPAFGLLAVVPLVAASVRSLG